MTRYILSLIAALFITLSSFAQGGLPSRFNVSYLNMAAGMPNNFADDIFQDSYGFVWISTHGGGLVRYDGFNYMNFNLGSSGISLRSNSCRNVYEDHFKRLWIAFEEGPQVLDLKTMQPVIPPCENEKVEAQLNKALKNLCTRMYCDAKGNVWMVSFNLLTRISFNEKGEVNRVLSISYPYNAPDLGLCDVYRNGTVVMCNNGVVSEFSVQNNRLVAKNISSMFLPLDFRYAGAVIFHHGKIWLGTNRGLYNSAKQEFHASGTVHSLQHEVVTSLAITEDDKLLVGTLCGVDIIDDKIGTIEHWNCSSVNPLSSNFVNSLLSKDGQIWVGTETGGITKLAPRQLQLEFFKHDAANPASLSPNAVNAMYAAPDGTLWVGTVEGGLNALAPGSRNFTHYTMANSGLPHNSVSTLAADNRGNLWIGTWGTGIAVMNLQQPGRIIPLVVDAKHQPFLNFAGVLVYDPINDGMWLGTNDGLFFYDLKRQQLIEPFKGCLNVRGCIGSLITRDGKLLMGCVQGMVEINLKSRILGKGDFAVKYHQYKLDDPKSGVIDKILSFCLAKDGKIWLGSNGYGLYCYNYNKEGKTYVKSFTTNNGLANNTVKGIVEDNQGMLWIATDNGLSIFNPKTETFSSYSRKDGLLSSQFYFNGAIRDAKGKIYLGTDEGLMAVTGVNHAVHNSARLRFTELLVDNQPVFAGSDYLDDDISIAKRLCIHESDKSFTIFFSALNYGNDTQGVYLYRMKGYENDWVQLKPGQHSVRYSTLPAGSYQFEVKYIPSFDSDKEQVISVDIKVTPYFWKSWWFVSLMVIAFIAFLLYIYTSRLEKMREREVEELYRPIEAALKDSDEPGKLQSRIQMILENQKRYQDSQKKSIEADRKQVAEKERPFMDIVMEVMEKNYDNSEFGVQELADEMRMNRSVLSKKLNAEAGQPTAQFIRNYRLDIAKKMITENVANRNITEIAYRVGFNDPKYFTRCFTKQYGESPSAFKESLEKEMK
ncbi:two-component regulator propeller domain-containing protein [Segatella copri]|uniref:Helix-turn-helix domain-containing protein n=1 Tax=Segatella copri TaxID=165179 RepID=A0A6G1VQR6_9BACT|nr:two-component regulator propeller domain-containing protein [Segatella copri]MQN60194.1 helix-turn-helix domain-containing protein [Segatella copri]MQP15198.1 helix-turn-helix domain-containing protein [Segatella copri]